MIEGIYKHTDPIPVCEICQTMMQKQISAAAFKISGEKWSKNRGHVDRISFTNKKTGIRETVEVPPDFLSSKEIVKKVRGT